MQREPNSWRANGHNHSKLPHIVSRNTFCCKDYFARSDLLRVPELLGGRILPKTLTFELCLSKCSCYRYTKRQENSAIGLRLFNVLSIFAAGGLTSCAVSMLWYSWAGATRLGAVGVSLLLLLPGLLLSAMVARRFKWLSFHYKPRRTVLAAVIVTQVFPWSFLMLVSNRPQEGPFPGNVMQLLSLIASLAMAALLMSGALAALTGGWDARSVNGLMVGAAATLVVCLGFQVWSGPQDFWTFSLALLPISSALLNAGFGYGLLRASKR